MCGRCEKPLAPEGLGTQLKPAWEPVLVFQKPLARGMTIAQNVLAYGTGAINVDASRIGARATRTLNRGATTGKGMGYHGAAAQAVLDGGQGRWPANVLLSCCGLTPCAPGCAVRELDRQSGTLKSGAMDGHYDTLGYQGKGKGRTFQKPGDSGGASRFFATFRYVAKPSRRERNAGCEGLPTCAVKLPGKTRGCNPKTGKLSDGYTGERQNTHPTVKPLKLMRYLITLVTAPGGTVLDPFAGSGSTGVAARQAGFRFIGIERDASYVKIARARIAAARAARPTHEERPAC